MKYHYQYPRMLVTVDAVIIKTDENGVPICVLLIKRKNEPYAGWYALPGGFPNMDELLVEAAHRELFEETGIKIDSLALVRVFDAPNRDPRDRNIAIAFVGQVKTEMKPFAGDDASEAEWFSIHTLPQLAFDHELIIKEALRLFH